MRTSRSRARPSIHAADASKVRPSLFAAVGNPLTALSLQVHRNHLFDERRVPAGHLNPLIHRQSKTTAIHRMTGAERETRPHTRAWAGGGDAPRGPIKPIPPLFAPFPFPPFPCARHLIYRHLIYRHTSHHAIYFCSQASTPPAAHQQPCPAPRREPTPTPPRSSRRLKRRKQHAQPLARDERGGEFRAVVERGEHQLPCIHAADAEWILLATTPPPAQLPSTINAHTNNATANGHNNTATAANGHKNTVTTSQRTSMDKTQLLARRLRPTAARGVSLLKARPGRRTHRRHRTVQHPGPKKRACRSCAHMASEYALLC